MNRSILKLTVATIAILGSSQAFATDYSSGVVTKSPSVEYTPVEFGSGWYLRGDISFNVNGRKDSSSQFVTSIGADVESEYDDGFGVRVGFGYIVNPSFRVDLTAEHLLESEFEGAIQVNLNGLANTVAGLVPVNNIFGIERVDASYSATSFMVNGYYDLPKFGKFTPYVGAGVGISRVELNERRTLTCIPDTTQACGAPAAGAQGATVSDVVLLDTEETLYEVSYQLALGTSYELSQNLDLDVGYSYFTTGDGSEISYSDGTAIDSDAFSVHRVNVGLRYELF
ncbi:MAG: outer membrane beta-barrel protein [Pseudomonadota bacterium]